MLDVRIVFSLLWLKKVTGKLNITMVATVLIVALSVAKSWFQDRKAVNLLRISAVAPYFPMHDANKAAHLTVYFQDELVFLKVERVVALLLFFFQSLLAHQWLAITVLTLRRDKAWIGNCVVWYDRNSLQAIPFLDEDLIVVFEPKT